MLGLRNGNGASNPTTLTASVLSQHRANAEPQMLESAEREDNRGLSYGVIQCAGGKCWVNHVGRRMMLHACQIIFVSSCASAAERLLVGASRTVQSPQPMARRRGAAGSRDSACAWPPNPPSVQSTCPKQVAPR